MNCKCIVTDRDHRLYVYIYIYLGQIYDCTYDRIVYQTSDTCQVTHLDISCSRHHDISCLLQLFLLVFYLYAYSCYCYSVDCLSCYVVILCLQFILLLFCAHCLYARVVLFTHTLTRSLSDDPGLHVQILDALFLLCRCSMRLYALREAGRSPF